MSVHRHRVIIPGSVLSLPCEDTSLWITSHAYVFLATQEHFVRPTRMSVVLFPVIMVPIVMIWQINTLAIVYLDIKVIIAKKTPTNVGQTHVAMAVRVYMFQAVPH